MARAHGNLTNNPLYSDLTRSINSTCQMDGSRLTRQDADDQTEADSCLPCHGTIVQVGDLVLRETDYGEVEAPLLKGWPNQGVGRVNPDGSLGACTACHTRHLFSVETARQPYTCSQCHKGPDVRAYEVYKVSKHGNLFSSHKKTWDFKPVPWRIGQDFTAPTCAACHISLLVDGADNVVIERTHRLNDRLPWRLFGLIYAHPQPKSPDTTIIKNKAGLPLPTELTGEPVSEYLISADEMQKKDQNL